MRSCSMYFRMWIRYIPISIIPTGMGAAGYTMPLPEKDEMFNTKGKMLQDITDRLLGGRVAEELIFEDITTGASQDIKQATSYSQSNGHAVWYV